MLVRKRIVECGVPGSFWVRMSIPDSSFLVPRAVFCVLREKTIPLFRVRVSDLYFQLNFVNNFLSPLPTVDC